MRKITVIIALFLAAIQIVSAQKVGLVLSGGGAKGAAHIGVIKALEENNIPIDYITGTSIGAIIGSLYAMGYSPEEMLELDRWAVTKLNELTEKCFAAYDNYEFHVVSHAINDFCVVELLSLIHI